MKFKETKLKNAFIIDPELLLDDRGGFARAFCRQEFMAHGLNPNVLQCNLSFNRRKGTLRGLHYQLAPFAEAKLIRCSQGAIYDAIVDLRPYSPTFKQWVGVELTAENRRMVYVPEGFGHGYLTLMDNTEVFYQASESYHRDQERGARWNDPAFKINWPLPVEVISAKDKNHPDFVP